MGLEGTARERGRCHGETLRGPIAELVTELGEFVGPLVGTDIHTLSRRVLAETGFAAAAQRWTPELLEEIGGIAEGSGIPRDTILALQFLEEMSWFIQRLFGAHPDGQCTVLGAFDQGDYPAILAQNADNPDFFSGRQTLLHVKHSGSPREAFVLTIPGLIGAYGLNSRGVGVGVNEMVHCMNKSTEGLGTQFVARGILARSTVEEAIEFVRAVKHASGNTFTIGGPGRVTAYECGPGKVVPFIPGEAATVTYHTNHPLANDDRAPGEPPPDPGSHARLEALERRLGQAQWPLTVEAAKDILSGHDSEEYPVCRHDVTRFSLVMELSARPVLHVATGPPCRSEFWTFTFP